MYLLRFSRLLYILKLSDFELYIFVFHKQANAPGPLQTDQIAVSMGSASNHELGQKIVNLK